MSKFKVGDKVKNKWEESIYSFTDKYKDTGIVTGYDCGMVEVKGFNEDEDYSLSFNENELILLTKRPERGFMKNYIKKIAEEIFERKEFSLRKAINEETNESLDEIKDKIFKKDKCEKKESGYPFSLTFYDDFFGSFKKESLEERIEDLENQMEVLLKKLDLEVEWKEEKEGWKIKSKAKKPGRKKKK